MKVVPVSVVSDEVVARVATALVECGIYPKGRLVGYSRDAYLTWARAALEASGYAALKADNERMKEALATLVYEVTHLSPMEDDGSHWAKISKDALGNARTILQEVSR